MLNFLSAVFEAIPWQALAASGVISALLVIVKKWFDVQNEKVMLTLVILSTVGVAAGNYLIHVPVTDPSIIAMQTAVIGFLNQPMYIYFVKPFMASFFEKLQERLGAQADAHNVNIRSAAITANANTATTGAVTAHVDGQDFSQ